MIALNSYDDLPVNQVIHGDCLEVMRTLPDCSVDAMIADPPAGISFMGKSWDSDKGGRNAWIAWLTDVMYETLRLLKPGAHALVWALPRTSHWTATALEDAGFEIRDSIEHIFSQGFPKSLDVSKAIDKMQGAQREVIGKRWASYPDTDRPSTKAIANSPAMFGAARSLNSYRDVTAPVTENAQTWSGWGTSLKPAHETWWLCRAPLTEANVTANVLRYGVGALNIDACRIPGRVQVAAGLYGFGVGREDGYVKETGRIFHNEGRWPSNFILSHTLFCTDEQCVDGCPVSALDQQSGFSPSNWRKNKHSGIGSFSGKETPTHSVDDAGGASRYFQTFYYCSKASKKDRSANGAINNTHPTAKNTALMRYLVRLVTPPGGIVLDPFFGSGSTGVACIHEGMRFIGIEQDASYCEIARARISHAVKEVSA